MKESLETVKLRKKEDIISNEPYYIKFPSS